MKAELGEKDAAWYSFLFRHEAARAIEAQVGIASANTLFQRNPSLLPRSPYSWA